MQRHSVAQMRKTLIWCAPNPHEASKPRQGPQQRAGKRYPCQHCQNLTARVLVRSVAPASARMGLPFARSPFKALPRQRYSGKVTSPALPAESTQAVGIPMAPWSRAYVDIIQKWIILLGLAPGRTPAVRWLPTSAALAPYPKPSRVALSPLWPNYETSVVAGQLQKKPGSVAGLWCGLLAGLQKPRGSKSCCTLTSTIGGSGCMAARLRVTLHAVNPKRRGQPPTYPRLAQPQSEG